MNDNNTEPHVITRQGCPIHYWLSGPPGKQLIVFTHGVVMDHTIFEHQANAFSKSYRVLTWDVRGHGLSRPMGDDFSINQATDDLIAILNQINCPPATLVGHPQRRTQRPSGQSQLF
ncbi:MAG: alpha/beta hydrolase [Planctomycetes bacterium]|nr:alpha/beta hydrolase [Planctomycetota bacterium]